MKIKRGNDRTAIIGESNTFKIPRINKLKYLRYGYTLLKRGKLEKLKEWLQYDYEIREGLKFGLFNGFHINRLEAQLAKEFSDIIIPTRSLLSGTVNIQPTVDELHIDSSELHSSFTDYIDAQVVSIGHTLEESSNLGLHENRVKFIDAGSHGLARLLKKYPKEIKQALVSIEKKIH